MSELSAEKQIGKRIGQLRSDRGWSQQKLADQMKAFGGRYANWRQGMVDKTERGARPLRVNEVFDFAAVLGVPPHILLGTTLDEVDTETLDARIAEVEMLQKDAEEEHQLAWREFHEADAKHGLAEARVRATEGRAVTLTMMLDALRARKAEQEGQG